MKTTMNVNFEKKTIDMTAAFAKEASVYGSEQYKALTDARREFPTYAINIVKTKKKKNAMFKNLNLEFIEKYIRAHDENNTLLEKFAALRGMEVKDDKLVEINDGELRKVASFFEIKTWFLDTYHETFEAYGKNIYTILNDAKKSRKSA